MNNISTRIKAAKLVEVYQLSVTRITKAYAELHSVQADLSMAFGTHRDWTIDFGVFENQYTAKAPVDQIIKRIKRECWKQVIERMEIRKFLSAKRIEKLDKKLKEDDLPELTLDNLMAEFEGTMENAADLLKDSVLEVYEFLRPASRPSGRRFKTNKKNAEFDLGKKIILTNIMASYHFKEVAGAREADLFAVDRVFHAIDGKGMPDGYRGELVDAINTGKTETEYFRFTTHKNGNLHLEFKRLDLVQKINEIAGGNRLAEGDSNE